MLFAKPNDDVGININAECILRNLQNIIAPSIAAHHIENGNHGASAAFTEIGMTPATITAAPLKTAEP